VRFSAAAISLTLYSGRLAWVGASLMALPMIQHAGDLWGKS
jgi:hypothetical protein